MQKINEEMLSFFINKYLGYMTKDAQKDVEVTDQGFIYKGELIVSLPGLRDKIVEKEKVTVGDLSKKEEAPKKTFDPRKVDVVIEPPKAPVVEETKAPEVQKDTPKEEPKVEELVVEPKPTQPYPGKRRGPKPKNKS